MATFRLMRQTISTQNRLTRKTNLLPLHINHHQYGVTGQLSLTSGNIGTIRESFVVNQHAYQHTVEYAKAGDLIVDKTYTIEIGGRSKDGKQIANVPRSFIAADDTEYAFGNKIPLWAFGFLY